MPEFNGHVWGGKQHVELQRDGQARAQIFTDGAHIYVRCAWPFKGYDSTFDWTQGGVVQCSSYQLGVKIQYEGMYYGPNFPNPLLPAGASILRAAAIEIFGYDPGEP